MKIDKMEKDELTYHVPVLLKESVDGMNIHPDGTYVDVTFGGAGHSREILSRLGEGGRLLGFDQDEDAERNIVNDPHFTFVRSNFRYLQNFLRYHDLLVPVIVLLIILFCRAILLAGSFYGQYLSIRKTETLLRNELSKLTPDTVEELSSKLPENSRSLVITYMRQVLDARDTPAQVQRLLANFEIAADKDLAISKTLTKLGPILGLMGTLIPMGPALAGLASGDIASMAYNMQIAFATTVVGLVAGAVGFLTQQVKQRWYLQDMTNLEFISELLNDKRSIHKTSEK